MKVLEWLLDLVHEGDSMPEAMTLAYERGVEDERKLWLAQGKEAGMHPGLSMRANVELERQLARNLERERCAKIAEDTSDCIDPTMGCHERVAKKIRSGI